MLAQRRCPICLVRVSACQHAVSCSRTHAKSRHGSSRLTPSANSSIMCLHLSFQLLPQEGRKKRSQKVFPANHREFPLVPWFTLLTASHFLAPTFRDQKYACSGIYINTQDRIYSQVTVKIQMGMRFNLAHFGLNNGATISPLTQATTAQSQILFLGEDCSLFAWNHGSIAEIGVVAGPVIMSSGEGQELG